MNIKYCAHCGKEYSNYFNYCPCQDKKRKWVERDPSKNVEPRDYPARNREENEKWHEVAIEIPSEMI